MKTKLFGLALIASLAVSAALDAQQNTAAGSPAALTLGEAIEIAERAAPILSAARHRVEMAEGDAVQAGLWPNPTLYLAAESLTPGGEGQTSNNPDQRQNLVGISQTIPIWGAPRKARKASKLELERWRWEYEDEKLELRARVEASFLAVLYHQESTEVMAGLAKALKEILTISRERLNSGDIAEVEVIKGEANHERFLMKAELAQLNLVVAKVRLAETMGDPFLEIGACLGALNDPVPDVSWPDLLEAWRAHPRTRAWQLRQDKAKADIAVAKSAKAPVPTIGLNYHHYVLTDQDTWDFSLGFEIPLFDRNQGTIRKVRENLKREQAVVAVERNLLESELKTAWADFETRKRRSTTFRENILPKMEEALRIEQASFAAGGVSMLEVLDVYRSLSEARLTYSQELYDLRFAWARLQKLSGRTL